VSHDQTAVAEFDAWPAERVRLSDRTLSVRSAPPTAPNAEPAVLVHGLGGSALNWTDLMGLLADRLDSRAPDLSGFGESPPPDDGDYSMAAHARSVVALIEADDRGPVHLFGNSLGGAVSTIVASTRPDLVRTLTLVAPALPDFRPGRSRSQLLLLALPGVAGLVSRRLATMPAQARLDGLLDLVYADPTSVSEARRAEAITEIERRATLPYGPDAMSASTRGLMLSHAARAGDALWAYARQVQAPTLVLYGGKDKLVLSSISGKASRSFPNAQVVVLPQTGHVAQMEHPALVADLVRPHLDQT